MRYDAGAERLLEATVEKVGEVHILHLSGQINELGADELSAALDRVLDAGGVRLVFDLSDVAFINSTGLGHIMRAYRAVKDGGYVRIAGAQTLVADVFSLTKLDKLLRLYKRPEEAVADPE
ncbi:MAG: STAS domain-containing protein [Candidatus Brocadiia bacterium]|jgi:anti-sigma B factor antagonist|nr:STAS domain-containing protein [Candidatus Brocadiia bacterium]